MSIKWHNETLATIFKKLQTSSDGIRDIQVDALLETYGENKVPEGKKVTICSIFLQQFISPLIIVLIVSTIIIFLLGEYVDGIIIGIVIVLNAVIGTIQEGKAQNTLRALTKITKGKATVLRGGKTQIIEDTQVVPGDILLLKDGDVVPADARLFEVNELKINESSLTGESNPVMKVNGEIDVEYATPQQLHNMVFRGTHVLSGLGKAVVIATGKETAIGDIASKLELLEGKVPLQENIRNLSLLLIWIILIFSSIIFIAGILNGNGTKEMFTIVVAMAVGVIPESLPVVVTVVLATGVWRMSKRNALVKKLKAVEALGQATVIALDKTGTITKNQMMVEGLWVYGNSFTVHGDGYSPDGYISLEGEAVTPDTHNALLHAGRISAFNATAEIIYDTKKKEWKSIMGDPTEAALKVFAQKMGMPKESLLKQYPLDFEIPFSFEEKHHSTLHTVDEKSLLSVTGSPEVVLELATTIFKDGSVVKITEADKKEVSEQIDIYSAQGFRIIGLGFNENPDDVSVRESKDISGLTFLGFVAITDVIRNDVTQAVQAARDAKMKVVMITGDNVKTAQSIGERIGVFREGDKILEGTAIEKMSADELDIEIQGVTIYARVSPGHKLRIIESYKRIGETIAMTGDGINDALSLVAADLGVAMGKVGTEVAREAADIVLLDDNFDNIRFAVEEGRSIYVTIRKSVLYLMSTNVAELLVIFFAVLFGWSMPMLASHIIWLNMITDSFLVAALAMDPKEPGLLKRKMKKPSKYLMDKLMFIRVSLIGGTMTITTLAMFYYYTVLIDVPMEKSWTVTLTVLSVSQWYNVWNIRSTTKSVFSMGQQKNTWLLAGTLCALLLHLVALYTPFMQGILRTTSLSLMEWIVIATVSLSVVVVEEIRKFFVRKNLTEETI